MTPAEIALARMLIAWDEWPGETWERTAEEALSLLFGDAATDAGFCEEGRLTPKGAALVARYREHMAAERDAKAALPINGAT